MVLRRPRVRMFGVRTESRDDSMLVRDYIRKALYNPKDGYFMQDVIYSPAGEEGAFLDFNELAGEAEYRLMLKDMYAKRGCAWLTPCEIFAPWYSFAIANYILKNRTGRLQSAGSAQDAQPLRILEFGGGNGTNMGLMLDFIKSVDPQLYERTYAVLVDISEAMSERQRSHVDGKHPGRCSFVRADMSDPGTALEGTDDECFVVGLEVLDNLPHDKVIRKRTSDDGEQWFQCHVEMPAEGALDVERRPREVRRSLEDSLIKETLAYFPLPRSNSEVAKQMAARRGTFESMWDRILGARNKGAHDVSECASFVPTGAVRLMKSIQDRFPAHRLVLADFDHLPAPTVPLLGRTKRTLRDGSLDALNYPLVASVDSRGKDVDFETYLLPSSKGSADIFFATDFDALSGAYHTITGRPARVYRSSEFLVDHAQVSKTRVAGGYNPLLEDFSNTRFMLT